MNTLLRNVIVLFGGLLFGCGLARSGMVKPEVVLSFLHLQDFGLLLVMGAGVAVTMAAFQLGRRFLRGPLIVRVPFETYKASLNRRTIGGAVVFGIGWGLSGLCPGAAVASIGVGNLRVLIAIGCMFLGAYVQARWIPERKA